MLDHDHPEDATRLGLDRFSSLAVRDPHAWRADVFVVYASGDARLKDELLMRLRPLEVLDGLVGRWHERCVTPGEPPDERVRPEVEHAALTLVLMSARLLLDDYVRGAELARAIERGSVVPVVLEHCDWRDTPLGAFAAIPSRPLREWDPVAHGAREVAAELRPVLEGLRSDGARSAGWIDAESW